MYPFDTTNNNTNYDSSETAFGSRQRQFGHNHSVSSDSFGNRVETIRNPFGCDRTIRTFGDGSTDNGGTWGLR